MWVGSLEFKSPQWSGRWASSSCITVGRLTGVVLGQWRDSTDNLHDTYYVVASISTLRAVEWVALFSLFRGVSTTGSRQ